MTKDGHLKIKKDKKDLSAGDYMINFIKECNIKAEEEARELTKYIEYKYRAKLIRSNFYAKCNKY